MSDQRTTSFSSLPSAIRHYILSSTSLVIPTGVALVRDGHPKTLISSGATDDTKHEDTCECQDCTTPFAGSNILDVRNKAFRDDAYFVIFSKNRLDFPPHHPAASLQFLYEKQPWLRHLRDIRFAFNSPQIDHWITNRVRPMGSIVKHPSTRLGSR